MGNPQGGNISAFIEEKLGLKVNMRKSRVDKPKGLKYLGFGFYYDTLHFAITKERLTRFGLVSMLDYYMKVTC